LSSRTNPITALARWRLIVDALAAVACFAIAGAWFIGRDAPISLPEDRSSQESPVEGTRAAATAFPITAFSADLWYEPPSIPEARPVRRTPLPRLTLLGVRRTDAGYTAMIKHEETNEILSVRVGQEIAGVRIESVGSDGVLGEFEGQEVRLMMDGGRP